MKPYFCEDGITIYHGDCREILPSLDRVDVVVADPPYPGLKGATLRNLGGGVSARRTETKSVGTPWGEDLSGLAKAWDLCDFAMFVFCSYHFCAAVPGAVGAPPIALVSWYKRNSMPSMNNVPQYETEFIWAFKKSSGLDWRKLRGFYDIPMLQAGCMAQERFVEDGVAVHPAQKPKDLIVSILKIGGETILDPYMGTGTTLQAAKDSGRKAVGIEIEERYCEMAAKRLAQKVLFGVEG
jgi:site-specific DNA-methyltransferase (adenine-specific)